MRKTVSAVLILTVFATIQCGRVAAYLYCKWQYEIVLNQEDCGCEAKLVDGNDRADSHNDLSGSRFQDKTVEFFFETKDAANAFADELSRKKYLSFDEPLSEPFSPSCFHPPTATNG